MGNLFTIKSVAMISRESFSLENKRKQIHTAAASLKIECFVVGK